MFTKKFELICGDAATRREAVTREIAIVRGLNISYKEKLVLINMYLQILA